MATVKKKTVTKEDVFNYYNGGFTFYDNYNNVTIEPTNLATDFVKFYSPNNF